MKIAYFFVSFFQQIGLQSIKHLTMQRETEANISITYTQNKISFYSSQKKKLYRKLEFFADLQSSCLTYNKVIIKSKVKLLYIFYPISRVLIFQCFADRILRKNSREMATM